VFLFIHGSRFMGSSHLAKQHTIRQLNRHDQIDISLYLSLSGFRLQEGMRDRVCVNKGTEEHC